MKLDRATLDFFTGPVLLMATAADAVRQPAIGRAMGVIVQSLDTLDVFISRWQWPQVVENIATSGRMALTASRASDYLTYQLKGLASVRGAREEDLLASRRYHDMLSAELGRLHIPAWISGQWAADRDMVVSELSISEAYVQTPGPLAGTSL